MGGIAELLEPLKGGKIPVELLVTTKDPESKTKAFEKCLEVIKGAGVSHLEICVLDDGQQFAKPWTIEESWHPAKRHNIRPLRR